MAVQQENRSSKERLVASVAADWCSWVRSAVLRAQKQHSLSEQNAVTMAVLLAVALAAGGTSRPSRQRTLGRLHTFMGAVNALCTELEPQEVAAGIMDGAAAATRYIQSNTLPCTGNVEAGSVAQWLQLFYNSIDLFDEDGIADWWERRITGRSASDQFFEPELNRFLRWLEEAGTDDEEEEEEDAN